MNQCEFYVSFYEIYMGKLFDLLNERNKLTVLEDKNQKVQIFGLEERLASSPEEMKSIIAEANGQRTTHNTCNNETSSRSHAICNVFYYLKSKDSNKRI
jgi:kinesin family protein 2/24